MKTAAKQLYLVALLFLGMQVKGQTSFSLNEAQGYALENNQVIKNADLDVRIAQKKVAETTTIGLPQINGEANSTYIIEVPTQLAPADAFMSPEQLAWTNYVNQEVGLPPVEAPDPDALSEMRWGLPWSADVGFTVSQLIFDGSYIIGLKAAKVYTQVSQQGKEKTIQEIKAMVTDAYHMAIIADENLKILSDSKKQTETILAETEKLLEVGFTDEQSVDQLKLMLSRLDNQILQAQNGKRIAYQLLKLHMGYPLNSDIQLSQNLESLLNADAGALLGSSFAPSQSIDYQLAETTRDLQELNLKNKKMERYPSVAAFLNHQVNTSSNEFDLFHSDKKYYPGTVAGVKVTIPIFSTGRSAHRIAQARMELEKSENDLELKGKSLEIDYLNAKANYESAIEQMKTAQNSLELSEKILKKTLIKHKEGMASSFELNQVESQKLESHGQYIQALIQMLNAKTSLEKILNKL